MFWEYGRLKLFTWSNLSACSFPFHYWLLFGQNQNTWIKLQSAERTWLPNISQLHNWILNRSCTSEKIQQQNANSVDHQLSLISSLTKNAVIPCHQRWIHNFSTLDARHPYRAGALLVSSTTAPPASVLSGEAIIISGASQWTKRRVYS